MVSESTRVIISRARDILLAETYSKLGHARPLTEKGQTYPLS